MMPISDSESRTAWQSWQPKDLLEAAVPVEQEIIDNLPVDLQSDEQVQAELTLSLIHISEPTRHFKRSRMPSSA